MSENFSVVISGSFRKHLEGIQQASQAFQKAGVRVLSPEASAPLNPGQEFVLFATDDTHDPKVLEQRHLDAITRADALYVYNPGGYVGASATLEIGWALASHKPIFWKEKAQDFTIALYSEQVCEPAAVPDRLRELRRDPLAQVGPRSSIADVQACAWALANQRGFQDETPLEIMLLMIEEVGELAKGVRKDIGLKFDKAQEGKTSRIETELADIFIYALHFANACKLDLFNIFLEKEKANSKRTWASKPPASAA